MNRTSVSILISGDVAPKPSNEDLFISGDLDTLVGKKGRELFATADLSTINLEYALTTTNNLIPKCDPNLKAHLGIIKGIKRLNSSVVCLANNHIMDFGEERLDDTLRVLKNCNLPM